MFGSVKQTTSKGGVEEQIISMYNKLCFFFYFNFILKNCFAENCDFSSLNPKRLKHILSLIKKLIIIF